MAAFREALGEVGEDLCDEFAVSALGADEMCDEYPRLFIEGHIAIVRAMSVSHLVVDEKVTKLRLPKRTPSCMISANRANRIAVWPARNRDPGGRGGDLFAGGVVIQVLFENIERIPMMVLHADCTQNRAHGTRGSALFPNDFAYIPGGDAEP